MMKQMKMPNSAWYFISAQGHLTLSNCSYPEGLREHYCHPANLANDEVKGIYV